MNKFNLLLFDIIKKLKTSYYLKEFEKAKRLSRDEISKYQFKKLKKLLLHAENNVPFYKKRFEDNNFSVKDFKNIEQIERIPPLTRSDLQSNWQDIIAVNYDESRLSKGSSSGSTGLPVLYYKDKNATSAGHAANLLGWSLSGWEMNMKGLHIWGNPSTVNNEWKRLSSKLKSRLFKHHKFPAYKLTDNRKFNELYSMIVKNKYEYIDGYTNAIYLLADFLSQKKISLKQQIKFVFTTAENLQDFQKKTIETTMAPVFDVYGCGEINGIAYQCKNCKFYHFIDPHVYAEFGKIVDNVGSREIIITDLDNYAFPLIRYKNDDLGIPTDSNINNCPIKFSLMKSVTGRQSDIIKLKNGGTLSVPSFFGSMLLKNINGIKQYQIEKVSDDMLYINLVKNKKYSMKDNKIIKYALSQYLDDKIQYKIRFLDNIKISKTGKFKILIDRTNN